MPTVKLFKRKCFLPVHMSILVKVTNKLKNSRTGMLIKCWNVFCQNQITPQSGITPKLVVRKCNCFHLGIYDDV